MSLFPGSCFVCIFPRLFTFVCGERTCVEERGIYVEVGGRRGNEETKACRPENSIEYPSMLKLTPSTQEIVGYVFRCFSARVNPYRVSSFVVQYFFIVVAPVFFAAAIYTILSLLINATGRQYAPLKPKRTSNPTCV